MPLNFPDTPNVGQTYNGPNNVVYTWDGIAWRAAGGGVGGAGDWDTLANKPDSFPPAAHQHDLDDTVGLVEALAAKQSTTDNIETSRLRIAGGVEGHRLVVGAGGTVGTEAPGAAPDSPLHTGEDPPPDPAGKPFWFDSNLGVLMVYYDDGTSGQWVSALPMQGGGGGTPTPTPTPVSGTVTGRSGEAITTRTGAILESR